jgi:hypothetical protein
MLVVNQTHRPRRYTEYFPEMLDVQHLAMEGVMNVMESTSK